MRGNLPGGRRRAGRGLSSLAKAFHMVWILGEILGQTFQRAGKIAGEIVAQGCAWPELLAQRRFEAVADKPRAATSAHAWPSQNERISMWLLARERSRAASPPSRYRPKLPKDRPCRRHRRSFFSL